MFRFVDHTAELEVELEADSPEGVLAEALRAFAELVGTGDGDALERTVSVGARDLPALLAGWLEELVFLAEAEGFVGDEADVSLSGLELRAQVRGRRGEPRPLVKAVTMHRLLFRPQNGLWRGRVVLDV